MPSSPTVSKFRICSAALMRLGADSISSFNDGNDRSTICSVLYPLAKDNVLSLHDWKFTITKKQLAEDATAPISKYTNQFILPTNRLTDGPFAVYDTNAAGAAPFKDFEIQGQRLLTEADTIYVDYQSNATQEAVWPPYFVSFMIDVMEEELCMPITDSASLRRELHERNFGTIAENGRGGHLQRAISRNSQEDPPQPFQDLSLIIARQEGS